MVLVLKSGSLAGTSLGINAGIYAGTAGDALRLRFAETCTCNGMRNEIDSRILMEIVTVLPYKRGGPQVYIKLCNGAARMTRRLAAEMIYYSEKAALA